MIALTIIILSDWRLLFIVALGPASALLFCGWPALVRWVRELPKTPAELAIADAMVEARS